ncbi:hypothetical protein [Hymenobacter sp. IS2118]|uniref:hypothetical protein n=1 Tax=Hymenobacter sp. IS2118 TaxID=1505605 RepID=UPI00054F9D42|nr:hypothetical protein [Hymenobacter sp. IS2118]
MKLTHTLLLALATASLALSSCSSEPSDWRPDDKVSLDMVEPGTRASESYAPTTPNPSIDNKGSQTEQAEEAPSAKSAMSANAEEGMRKRGTLNDAGKSGQQADEVHKAE